MPKIIEDLPRGVLGGRGRPRKYDWDTLFDGSAWLVEADELTVPPYSFVRVAHEAAKRRGLSLSTSVRPEGVYLLAVKASPSVVVEVAQVRQERRGMRLDRRTRGSL